MNKTYITETDLALQISTIANKLKQRISAEELVKMDKREERDAFYESPGICIIVDVQTNCIEKANKNAVDFYGYTKNEFARMRFTDLQPEIDEYFPGLDLDEKVNISELEENDILQQVLKNGTPVYVEFTSQNITVDNSPKKHFTFKKVNQV